MSNDFMVFLGWTMPLPGGMVLFIPSTTWCSCLLFQKVSINTYIIPKMGNV